MEGLGYNLLHQPDWKDRSIKIADVMKAVPQTKTFGHTAQASSGEEKVRFLSRGRGGGLRGMRGARGAARGGRGGYPQGRHTCNTKPLRKMNKRSLIMVILAQMLQLRFAISPTVRTSR